VKASLPAENTKQAISWELWTANFCTIRWQKKKCYQTCEQVYWHPRSLHGRRGLMSSGIFQIPMWLCVIGTPVWN